jgi:glyoxylase-like metal-dependent hydrolase (beta-lactamase superfamily II)
MCYRVDQRWLLTGDTLFLSGVGRPDLEASREEARARAILLHGSLQRLFALDPTLLVLPGHTSHPVAFDHRPITAALETVREAVRLPANPAVFADDILARVPATPPNHHAIVTLNEAGELPGGDLTDLEAGANRCAVS